MASRRLQQISSTLLPPSITTTPPQNNNTMAAPKKFKLNDNGIPSFDDLPLREGDPHHSAWGLYGADDELGTLNRLTNERVVAAARDEIQKGIRYVIIGRGSVTFA